MPLLECRSCKAVFRDYSEESACLMCGNPRMVDTDAISGRMRRVMWHGNVGLYPGWEFSKGQMENPDVVLKTDD